MERLYLICVFAVFNVFFAVAEPVAVTVSSYKGESYASELSAAKIASSPVWINGDNNPPLAVGAAISSSKKTIEAVLPKDESLKDLKLLSVTLSFPENQTIEMADRRCYYVVTWRGARSGMRREGGRLYDEYDMFRIIVLMDGEAIRPELHPPLSINTIQGQTPGAGSPSVSPSK